MSAAHTVVPRPMRIGLIGLSVLAVLCTLVAMVVAVPTATALTNPTAEQATARVKTFLTTVNKITHTQSVKARQPLAVKACKLLGPDGLLESTVGLLTATKGGPGVEDCAYLLVAEAGNPAASVVALKATRGHNKNRKHDVVWLVEAWYGTTHMQFAVDKRGIEAWGTLPT